MSTLQGLAPDDDGMQVAIRLPDGFPVEDIEKLCSLMADADPFVPAFEPSGYGLYSLLGQVWSLQVEEIETILLPDRNVASRMAQIAKGMAIGKDAQLIAGINAFAHFFDIVMEPSIAFHELARREGNEAALQELAWFRAADHGDKFDWLEVALGRADRLASPQEERALESHDLAAGLRDWSTGYGAVLKLAEIELFHPGAPIEKIMVLLEWMHCDYFFAGPVATMACVYFAPINAPKAGLMKSLRSPGREKAIHGAKNAAWDALYLSSMNSLVNKAAGGPKRYIYASLDWRARLIARMAMAFGGDGAHRDAMAAMLGEWWAERDAEAIADKLTAIALDIDLPQMEGKRRKAAEGKLQTIAAGEKAIRDWSSDL
ncbi:hypothetical protein C8245_05160 [Paracidovorax avenae]|uniref:hypothetical protein n=1 Tax=Paracidovorax avenae TaxID=80867 RepID=UPI000D214027|nr:hypothetical protein [Paracidovorax avenae]AVS65173.1 hypothetical protein C8245_05160 [Paracidovorax avenae]